MTRKNKWQLLAILLLAGYAAWLVVGIFPISPVEGDEQGVINGAAAMARGELGYLGLAYLPEIQPGSYALLSMASRCTGVSVEKLFAAGTAGGAVLFAWFAAKLVGQLSRVPFWVALAAVLWCQEISAAAYYMNTTALGMWLTFAALLLAGRPPTWRTGAGMIVCIAVAGWIRIDCLLPTPALPLLVFAVHRDRRITICVTALTAAGSLALVWALYHASGISWNDITQIYSGRGAIEGWWPTVRSLPLLLSPLLCVLLVAGFFALLLCHEWSLLGIIAAGCAATLPVYGTSLASTKYFYHLVPFLVVPALYAGMRVVNAWQETRGARRITAGIALALVCAADQALALQTSSPEFRRYEPQPVLATLARLPGRTRPVSIVIGPGEIIPTTDGFRLRGGGIFAPWIWRREKIAMRSQLDRFTALLRDAPETTVYYSGWLPYQMTVRVLRAEGFVFTGKKFAANTMPYSGEWQHDHRRVRTDYLAYRASEYFDPARQPANPTGSHTFFLGDLGGDQPITELADAGQWQRVWPEHGWRVVTFYQRRLPAATH